MRRNEQVSTKHVGMQPTEASSLPSVVPASPGASMPITQPACDTDSIAYSTWYSRPSGLKVVVRESVQRRVLAACRCRVQLQLCPPYLQTRTMQYEVCRVHSVSQGIDGVANKMYDRGSGSVRCGSCRLVYSLLTRTFEP